MNYRVSVIIPNNYKSIHYIATFNCPWSALSYALLHTDFARSIIYTPSCTRFIPNESIFSTIYQNGVFPAQGVRPVLSTISSIFDNCLPTFLFKAIEKEINVIPISYEGEEMVGIVGDERVSCKVVLPISNIKKEKSIDETVLTSVHEAGHILTYALLFKITPVQMRSITSNSDAEGFTGIHLKSGNKESLKNDIIVNLAGQAAEEIIFGDNFKSTGASGDIRSATMLATTFVRNYGFDGFQSHIGHPYHEQNEWLNTDIGNTNTIVEDMLKEGKKVAIDMINSYKLLFKDIVQTLINFGEIQPEQLILIFEKHGEKIKEIPSGNTIIFDYKKKWEEYV